MTARALAPRHRPRHRPRWPSGLPPEAVIFDMDGVLLDSEPLHHQAANEVLAQDGHAPLSLAEYTRYLGTTDEDMWRDLRAARGLRQPHEHYLSSFDACVLAAYREHAVAAPGAAGLLAELAGRGLPMGVASSSRARWVQTCLEAIGLRRYFSCVAAGDMVARGKPDPEIYLLAARLLGARPAQCIAFDDSPAGVTAALRAGMHTVAVCTPYTPPGLARGAHVTVSSLAEVSRALHARGPRPAGPPGRRPPREPARDLPHAHDGRPGPGRTDHCRTTSSLAVPGTRGPQERGGERDGSGRQRGLRRRGPDRRPAQPG